MRSAKIVLSSLLMSAIASPATSSVFAYDFNSYTTSQTGAKPAGFDVLFGSADIVRSGDGGLVCAGGSGACLAFNRANPTQGTVIQSETTFTALAGELVQLSLDISGSQTGTAGRMTGLFVTGKTTFLDDLTVVFGGKQLFTAPSYPSFYSDILPIPADLPFTTLGISFRPETDFAFKFQLGGGGTIIDNLAVRINEAASAPVASPTSDVPEPASWMMLVLGFSAVGAIMRATPFRGRGRSPATFLRPAS